MIPDPESVAHLRNEIRARVMREHKLSDGTPPVMIRVRERTGRVANTERPKDKGPHVEQWIVTYKSGETRTYERLEPIVSDNLVMFR